MYDKKILIKVRNYLIELFTENGIGSCCLISNVIESDTTFTIGHSPRRSPNKMTVSDVIAIANKILADHCPVSVNTIKPLEGDKIVKIDMFHEYFVYCEYFKTESAVNDPVT